jgi:hypothetical protein
MHDRIDDRGVADRPAADHRSEGGHVSLCLRGQRPASREMVLIAGWPGIVGSQKTGGTIAIQQLAEIGSTICCEVVV